MWLKADKIGMYSGQCAEFCGLTHAHMRFNVQVVSQETYDAVRQAVSVDPDGCWM